MLASRRAKVPLCHSDIAQEPGSADPLEQALSEPQSLVDYFNFDVLNADRLSEVFVYSKRALGKTNSGDRFFQRALAFEVLAFLLRQQRVD